MVELGEVARRRSEGISQAREVRISAGETRAGVLLDGGILNYWSCQGVDGLYPCRTIQTSAGKRKERGGGPPLFPRPGPPGLGDPFPKLPQHGFARNMPWVEGLRLGANTTVLGLYANKETREVYPYDFGIGAQITVEEGGILKYEVVVVNSEDRSDMPFMFGWHPYFPVPLKELQNVRANLPGFETDLDKLKGSQIFDWQEEVEFEIPGTGSYIMRPSKEYEKLIVWSDGETDKSIEVEPGEEEGYICFEPWTSGPFTIHDPEERITLSPRESILLSVEMQFQPA